MRAGKGVFAISKLSLVRYVGTPGDVELGPKNKRDSTREQTGCDLRV